jgi:hypothetical protein
MKERSAMPPERTTKLLMLDSGAYSAWTKREPIDLEKYLRFCEQHPDTDYFVNLDIIPGIPKAVLEPAQIEAACQQSWDNYQRMIDRLPPEKVIPVFHQGESIEWLDKYLSLGVKYIGISPANDKPTVDDSDSLKAFPGRRPPTHSKRAWLKWIRRYLFDADGAPVVKMHGFGVSSLRLITLKGWKWHSVDSSAWKTDGAWGSIYLPSTTNQEWDFAKKPRNIPISTRISDYRSFGPDTREKLSKWLADCGTELELVRTQEKERHRVNAHFIQRANQALSSHVDHIYLAGASMPWDEIEQLIGKRLLSYYYERHAKILKKRHTPSKPAQKQRRDPLLWRRSRQKVINGKTATFVDEARRRSNGILLATARIEDHAS